MERYDFLLLSGDHLYRGADIATCINCRDTGVDMEFDLLTDLTEHLYTKFVDFDDLGIALRGLWSNGEVTLFFDPEQVDTNDDRVLQRFADTFGSPVYRIAILPDFETYIYTKFDGHRVRDFYVCEGDVMADLGERTPEEEGFALDADTTADTMEGLLLGLGVDLNAIGPPYLSKRFERNA